MSVIAEFAKPGVMLFLLSVLLLLPATSRADPVCDSLGARLASIPKVRFAGDFQSRNVVRQLRATEFDARRFGCGFRFFGGSQAPFCPQIMARIAQLRSQLARSTAAGPFDGQRRWLIRQMQANGCVPMAPKRGSITTLGGSYRTLCVRKCDGYFFPINFSVPRSRFKTDEATCKSMYPDSDAELFVNRPGEDFERAVSLKGEAYSSKPYASSYQKQFIPQCQAKLTEGLATLGKRFAARFANSTSKMAKRQIQDEAPVPTLRPAPSEDPETLANREGLFTFAPLASIAALGGEKLRIIAGDLFVPVIAHDGRGDLTPLREPANQVAGSETAPSQLMMFVAPSREAE